MVPVEWTGRAYIALVVPAGCTVTSLSLFDASGHVFATSIGKLAASRSPGCHSRPASAGSS